MLQRIQTVWMVLALLCSPALFYSALDVEPQRLELLLGAGVGACILVTLVSIFSFKNRKRQIMLNNLSILINALLVGLLAYWLLNLPGGMHFPEKGIEPLFPLLAMVCLLIANMCIRRDDRLVKSVDRLR